MNNIIGSKIAKARNERGWTQDKLAEEAGIHRVTLAKYESGKVVPGARILTKLASALGVTADYLTTEKPTYQSLRHSAPSPNIRRIPVLGTIPAGIPFEAIEDIEDYEELNMDEFSPSYDYFALRIKGDSMTTKYEDGDIVIFRVQYDGFNGKDCAVMVNGEEATFKRIKMDADGITLIPLNTLEYEPRHFTPKQVNELPVRIIGVAVQIRREV